MNLLCIAKKLEEAQNQKRADEAQAARKEDLYYSDPEDILQHRDEDEEKALSDLEERFTNQELKDHEEIDGLINQELRDHQEDMKSSPITSLKICTRLEKISATCDSMF
jgi:hypothetical protein